MAALAGFGTMTCLMVGLTGLVVGSFLNVVIHRVPLRRSVALPASRCPKCETFLRARDNIPLVSYAVLRGRCRSCGWRIPARYPAVEALTGFLFIAAALEFRFGYGLLEALVLISTLVPLAVIDVEHRTLPNIIVGPATLAGLVLSTLRTPETWWVNVLSAAGLGGGLLAISLVRPGGLGMGDVKMGCMLGAFLGPYGALAIFLGALGGAVLGGALMVLGIITRRTPLPFGAFLGCGALVALLAGPELWRYYLNLVGGP